jgi:hypothetical protein
MKINFVANKHIKYIGNTYNIMTTPPDKHTYNICNDDLTEYGFIPNSSSERVNISYDAVDIENPSPVYSNQHTFLEKINTELHHLMADATSGTTEHTIPKTESMLFGNTTRTKLENMFIDSNSPISSNHSDSDHSDYDPATNQSFYSEDIQIQLIHEEVENVFMQTKRNYKKITYEEIEQSLSKYYDKNNKYSNEMDVLITFMRGQKHIFQESAYIAQMKLYAITITSLTITSLITVITPFVRKYSWSIILISGGNAIATVLMTILNFLRLDSARHTFALLSTNYDHFEHTLELTNNKLLFMDNEQEQTKTVLDTIHEIEFKMGETKKLCPVIVPEEIKKTFPIICQTNIFSLIKKLEMYRKQLIIQFKDIKNEIRYILYKWSIQKNTDETPRHLQEKTRLLFLMEIKEKVKKELIEYKQVYNQIDDLFMKEIKNAETNRKCIRFLYCKYTKMSYDKYTNPIIKDHIELICSQ